MAVLRPYSGVQVLDLTLKYGPYAARLFADLGARVIRVEEPAYAAPTEPGLGEPAAREFLNASKNCIVTDLSKPDDVEMLDRLAERSSLIFVEAGGIHYNDMDRLRRLNPTAVVTAISPYGLGGPWSDAEASDLVLQAAGGIAWMSGRPDAAPLSLPAGQASMVASVYAATASAIALWDAETTGAGHLIDVSVQECIAHSLQNAIQVWDLEGRISRRGGEGTRDASEDVFPCRDGYVFLASPLSLGTSWISLVAWIGELGHPCAVELSKPRWSDRAWRLTGEARAAFREAFSSFTLDRTKADLTREAVARRIVMGPVNRISDLIADEQLTHMGFFTRIDGPGGQQAFPGAPYRFSRDIWRVEAPRHRPGAEGLEG